MSFGRSTPLCSKWKIIYQYYKQLMNFLNIYRLLTKCLKVYDTASSNEEEYQRFNAVLKPFWGIDLTEVSIMITKDRLLC